MDDLQAQLLTEQFDRLKDSIESRFQRIETSLNHHSTLESERLAAVKADLMTIKADMQDHESRIRVIDDSVITNKTSTTIMQAGQAALTLIAASIAAWLGGR